jgi:hypothetical protein
MRQLPAELVRDLPMLFGVRVKMVYAAPSMPASPVDPKASGMR